ncbi:YlxR family protein [Thermoanaerobacterium thermosaccharolyticum]|uniref:RNase P modulator RnpM n=1 Tax=Thermoanaerobacterium thermosaccharolyticum TaxID=1517 RepID=UPI003DA7F91A
MKAKKIPMRMCLGCQEMKPKKELLRIVKKAHSNDIQVDLTGKMSGRGCYICKNIDCLERALKSKKIERALETSLTEDIIEQMRKEVSNE